MDNGHDNWKADIALRLCGAMSCGTSYLAIRSLAGLRVVDGQLPDGALPFILAAAGFLLASAGSALLALGHHVFDEVEINQRWRTPLPVEDASLEVDTLGGCETRCDRNFPNFAIHQDNTREFDLARRA